MSAMTATEPNGHPTAAPVAGVGLELCPWGARLAIVPGDGKDIVRKIIITESPTPGSRRDDALLAAISEEFEALRHTDAVVGVASTADGRVSGRSRTGTDRLLRMAASHLPAEIHPVPAATSAVRAEMAGNPHLPSILLIKLGPTVETAVLDHGRIFPGLGGAMADLAHGQYGKPLLKCGCGRRGCLQATASTRRLETALKQTGNTPGNADVLPEGVFTHPWLERVIRESGAATGKALATAANLINPRAIIVTGVLPGATPSFLKAAQQSFDEDALTTDARAIKIDTPYWGLWTFAVGAALTAARRHDNSGQISTSQEWK